MLEKIKTVLSLVIIIVCLPYLVTFIVQGDVLTKKPQTEMTAEEADIQKLVGIVAREMPFRYETEALKAQAVIARSNLAYARAHDLTEPEGVTGEQMRKILGAAEYQKHYELLRQCVCDTKNEVAVYKGETVFLPYHAVSAGCTRTAAKAQKKPYLKAVSVSADMRADRFWHVQFFTEKQFKNRWKQAYPKLETAQAAPGSILVERDASAYALTVEFAGKRISAEKFQRMFSLASACFSIKEIDGRVRIVTKGYGDGFGLSQFGANEMAKEKKTYREILEYFYPGITIGSDVS